MTTSVGSRTRIEWSATWDDQVRRSTEARRAMEQIARAGAAAAQRLAPVLSGDYRDGIDAVVESVGGAWVAAVVGRDFKTLWIERGARSPDYTTPAQHVIRRGVETTGVKVVAGAGGWWRRPARRSPPSAGSSRRAPGS